MTAKPKSRPRKTTRKPQLSVAEHNQVLLMAIHSCQLRVLDAVRGVNASVQQMHQRMADRDISDPVKERIGQIEERLSVERHQP
jgi:hypothetical protein